MSLRVRDRQAASGDIPAEWRLRRVKVSSRVRLAAHRSRCAPASPKVAAHQHVDERHERDKVEQSPCQLRTAPDIRWLARSIHMRATATGWRKQTKSSRTFFAEPVAKSPAHCR